MGGGGGGGGGGGNQQSGQHCFELVVSHQHGICITRHTTTKKLTIMTQSMNNIYQMSDVAVFFEH